jgi:hypothetical protein
MYDAVPDTIRSTCCQPTRAENVMSRSLSHLRRGLLGVAVAGSLGFGATQAFAGPSAQAQRLPWCDPSDTSGYYDGVCTRACQRHGYAYGYCQQEGPSPDNGICACANE